MTRATVSTTSRIQTLLLDRAAAAHQLATATERLDRANQELLALAQEHGRDLIGLRVRHQIGTPALYGQWVAVVEGAERARREHAA